MLLPRLQVLRPLLGFAVSLAGASAQTVPLEPLIVTASRSAATTAATPYSVVALSGDALRDSPSSTIDGALRAVPGFSLFRRSDSLSANPTAQGVSLRGLGPSGASRSLVLLDGVPLNDPFGGWVAWSKIPRFSLGGAEIVRGGGSGVWGNAALGGVVQLLTAPAQAGSGAAGFEAGAFSTHRAEVSETLAAGKRATLRAGARWFETDGFIPLSNAQRGSVDRPLASRHTLVHADYALTTSSGWQLTAGARAFDESRGNGTPLQHNDSRENAGRVRITGTLSPDATLDVLAYAQRQHFASSFSAVAATRTTETPSLDQYDVPATAFGAAAVATFHHADHASTTVGADVRQVSGETREDFLYSAGVFQRRRFAGGDQLTAGTFVAHQRSLAPDFDTQFSLRLDHWENTAGHRTEWIKSSGAVVRDDRFADRRGEQLSPNLGVVWRPRADLRLRAAGNRAFRVPTLNEYYRPFRVGTVNTEANPALKLETVTAGEVGFEFTRRAWNFSGGAFTNSLRDAVANVTLSTTPALTQRQRLNLDRVRVRGLEARIGWQPTSVLCFSADYLFSDATVASAAVAPQLVGRRLAQVPRHSASLQAAWSWRSNWSANAVVRATSAQFEDDENALRLARTCTVDLAVRWAFQPGRELGLAVENLADERAETGRTSEGLVSLGNPRQLRAGLTQRW